MIQISPASPQECLLGAELFCQMWQDSTPTQLAEELSTQISSGNTVLFLARDNGTPVAVAQCGLRHDYVEGAKTSPVGFLEGIYVAPEYRRQGIAARLCRACEHWAVQKGCSEFASDCELQNTDSYQFHKKVGFAEAGRIICFLKRLSE